MRSNCILYVPSEPGANNELIAISLPTLITRTLREVKTLRPPTPSTPPVLLCPLNSNHD